MNTETKNKLLSNLFYGPSSTTSIKKLYEKVKRQGITYNEVKTFVQSQEVYQMHLKKKRPKHFFPIVAKYVNEIWQIDIFDVSNLASSNNNFKYFFIAIDVFSRFASVVPLKNKNTKSVLDAIKESFITMQGKPKIINADLGSEFINYEFKKLCEDNNIEIKYVPKNDSHKLGIVNRFCRTIREMINKYLDMHDTTKYIDAFVSIMNNYNESYHSGINKAPSDVTKNDKNIIELTNKKYNKALNEEQKFNVGDKVRFLKNKALFEKGSMANFSKTVHTIVSKTAHTYTLDNDKVFKYYELQLIKDFSKEPSKEKSNVLTMDQLKRNNKIYRIQRKEDINKNDIISNERIRKRPEKLKDYI